MSKYHVTIGADHWERQFPGFVLKPVKERSAIVRHEMDRISEFLNEEVPIGMVRLLITDEQITIDPLKGDVFVHDLDNPEEQ